MKGGTGKVVASKPNDRIFLFYSDHGGPGVLGQFPTFSFYCDVLKLMFYPKIITQNSIMSIWNELIFLFKASLSA